MKPKYDITNPPPQPKRQSRALRITDRQVEIMTATLCEAILRAGKITPQNVHEAPADLIGAMITHVSRLNVSVFEANARISRSVSSKALDRTPEIRIAVAGREEAE